MKRALLLTFTISVLFLSRSAAQQYKTAVGLGIDFGDGSTLVGPAIKYFF